MVLFTEIVPLATVGPPELGDTTQFPLHEPAPPAADKVMLALTWVKVASVIPLIEVAPLQLLLVTFNQ
jgi:hypothetical protein